MNNSYMAHHGILGQKWGVRRYQNSDGTLTSQGRQRYGRLGTSGASASIINTKRGISKYKNKDGSLTKEGERRWERDKLENAAKKKDKQIDVSTPDPNRWVREDRERKKDIVDTSADLVKELRKIEQESRPKATTTKLDLSQMSDKELRDRINREMLERQYNNLFAEETQPTISKGREIVKETLEVAGSVLAITSSTIAIALSVQKLKGEA